MHDLEPFTESLVFTVDQADAEVLVDEVSVGKTPLPAGVLVDIGNIGVDFHPFADFFPFAVAPYFQFNQAIVGGVSGLPLGNDGTAWKRAFRGGLRASLTF